MALELERAVCSICFDSESVALPTEFPYSSPVRQSNPGFIHSERRGNSFTESAQSDMQVGEADRQDEHSPISPLPPGEVQLHRRSPLKGTASIRMASVAHCNKPIIPSLGHSRRRLVHVCRNSRGQQIRLARLQRSLSPLLKRLQPKLGLPSRLDISASQPHPTSSSSTEQCQGLIHSNSTTLRENILVGGSTVTSPRNTSDHRKALGESGGHCDGSSSSSSRPTEPLGLVSWRWSEQICYWSETEKQLLNTSWRQSTMGTYYPAIKRWLKWCDLNKVNCIILAQNCTIFLDF
ncbi:hypothetical protein O0L34_g1065 [Tuta absoluta]|nr:hypothetical protein O0L34_g1065 [Tuta absoluta]